MAFTDIDLTLVSPPLAAARRRKLTAERRAISQARLAFYAFARGETLMRGEQELLAQYFDDYGSNRKDPVIGEELRIAQDLTARLRSGSLQRESLNPAQRAIIAQQQALQLNNAAQAKAGGILGSQNALAGAINGGANLAGSVLNSPAVLGNQLPSWATTGLGI